MSPGAEEGDLLVRVVARLAGHDQPLSAASVAAAVRREGVVLGSTDAAALLGQVRSELRGLGPLQPLLADETVTDVLVNAPGEVWVDHGDGLQRSPVHFSDETAVRRLAQRLALSAGRRLDAACPTVDARLPGGVRLHAVIAPVSPTGTLISLRVARRRVFLLPELVQNGTVTRGLDGVLTALVRGRVSLLVTGGTGTGKTTVLGALLSLVPPGERIVLVEECGELAPQHPHVVRLECRGANVEGAGVVDLRRLVREALRMRPDRIVVGEVRGGEVVELLAALNTGHDGGAGTVHASTAAALPARLEALAMAAGLPRAALHSQLCAAVHVVVHVERLADGQRLVREIGCLQASGGGLAEVVSALRVSDAGMLVEGPGAPALADLVGAAR